MIDWKDCPLVHTDPRYVSGQPALRSDPRLMVEPLVESVLDYGETAEEVAEQFGLSADTIRSLVNYAKMKRGPRPA